MMAGRHIHPRESDGRRLTPAVPVGWWLPLLLLFVLTSTPAAALDVFTLWRQPMIPLQMIEGSWADYRFQVMAGGRRETSLTRVACLGRRHGSDDRAWILELLPLHEDGDGNLAPVPGEGVRLRVSRRLLRREGRLMDSVLSVRQWRDGVAENLSPEQLREDPLISMSLNAEFQPEVFEVKGQATRVVGGHDLLCDQFVLSEADTQSVDLPAGRMIQVSVREVTAAINSEIPFLGLAFATERQRSESTLDPPSRRFSPPPPQIRVEVMELLGYGAGAVPVLPGTD